MNDLIYSEKWEILDLDWNTASIDYVPNEPGVYMLVNKFTNKIEYIGQSKHLRYRLSDKMHPVFIPDLHIIKYMLIEDDGLRHYTEYRAIELCKPELNKRAGVYQMGAKDIVDANYRAIFD